ncbi:hypothetical protein [uncultured Tateyamaria sp.]|uniref:hypothetical protein n=1 Tax=uncultured Tateyamaria sp. TaxID=455651 RepID=UPI0026116F00|nr:hypothetical protein [uncultured Tateyamaria sp.]
MQDDQVPPVDANRFQAAQNLDPSISQRHAEAELRVLEADADALELKNGEARQRSHIRIVAVLMALAVIVGMTFVLYHTTHAVFLGYIDLSTSSAAVALVVGPISSITLVVLAFIVAAFRRFEEKDNDRMMSVIQPASRYISG